MSARTEGLTVTGVTPRTAVTPLSLARRFPLVTYLLLACLLGWSPYLVTFLTGGSGAENLPLGPVVATLVVVSCQGRDELRTWARRVRSWRAGTGWYALAVLVPMVLQLLIVVANHGWGAPLPTSGQLAEWPQVPVTFLTMLIFVGIGEETGWTAFAAPILLRRHGFVVAWALAAGMRTLWHLPLMVSGHLPWVLGTVGNAAFTMVSLQLLLASNGRWSLVAVWHAALNAVGAPFTFAMVSGDDRARLGFLFAGTYSVVALAVHIAGGRRLRLHDTPTPYEGEAPPSANPPGTPTDTSAALRRATAGGPHGA